MSGTVDRAQRAALRAARVEVEEFHYDYAATLESGAIERWPDFFTEDGVYELIARDNHESGLPLGLMSCDGKGMLKDRAYAIKHTEMYAPRYLALQITNTRVHAIDGDLIRAEARYVLFETLVDGPSQVQQVGKYFDTFERRDEGLLIKRRQCVFDTVVINNCLVFPV